jgi:ADP-ribose pyrophosphatase YjhB (NUDIX family)
MPRSGAHLRACRPARLRGVRPPAGIAPVAGHVDQHGGPEHAACAEVGEEVGLVVTSLHLVTSVCRPNRCRRLTRNRVGHQWSIYRAEASGQIRSSPRETRALVATARPASAVHQPNCGLRGRTAERRTARRDAWLGASVGPVPPRPPAGDVARRRPGPDREHPLTGDRGELQRASTTCPAASRRTYVRMRSRSSGNTLSQTSSR